MPMIQKIDIATYYSRHRNLPIVDVRSPGEYARGHIPWSVNIPLFTDDERAHVGTVYVHQSREAAITLGYRYVTPKLDWYVSETLKAAPGKQVVVHCWRGGMRSASFAQHLHENGFDTIYLIEGGYKSYRNEVLSYFDQPFRLRILGGYTGSGKTYLLKKLQERGCQAIDLEGIAGHKGSAFGGIGQNGQPTTEQFENNLREAFGKLDAAQPIWLEDESHNIGRVNIPMNLFRQMRRQTLYFLDIPQEQRIEHLVAEYGSCHSGQLAQSIERIAKRLGGQAVKDAIAALHEGNYHEVARLALHYYDKSYRKGMNMREGGEVVCLNLSGTDIHTNAETLLNYIHQHE